MAISQPCVLLHAFSTFEVGGPQVRFASFANRFGGKYKHLLVAMDGNYECVGRLQADVDFSILDVPIHKGKTLRNARAFRQALKRYSPSALVTYNWGAIEWALANLRPVCRHVHIEDGFGPEEAEGQLARRNWFRRGVLGRRTQVIVPSLDLRRIASQTWKIGDRQLTYIPNGIDCRRFCRPVERGTISGLEISNDELVVGTVAGLRPEKNLTRLVQAFAEVRRARPARLLIAGDGPERERVEECIHRYQVNDSVHLLGALAAPERLLAAIDVFAMSSDTEQMPYSILEAMAAGLPIAGVDVGDVRHMVAPQNSPYIVACNERALAGSILKLLLGNDRRTIGLANQRRAWANFEQEQMFSAYDALFAGHNARPRRFKMHTLRPIQPAARTAS
jgi:glycosyltransferase involved in cell wall biosynthesis